MPPESRIDRRVEACALLVAWSLYGIAKCSAVKANRRQRAIRRWWGF